jgi:hypothetical protein
MIVAVDGGVVKDTVELPIGTVAHMNLYHPTESSPAMNISAEMDHMSDEIVPAMVVPLYQAGMQSLQRSKMAPD